MLSITSEGAKQTEECIERFGFEPAYAYDRKGAMSRYFGVRGIPSAVLVGADGKVVWKGHPGTLPDEKIKESLKGALPKPLWEWPKEATNIKKALLKGKLAKALEEARKVEGDYREVIEAMIAGRVTGVQSAHARGDFLEAVTLGEAALKELKGLPEVDRVKETLAAIKGNSEAQKVIKAQKKLQKLIAKARDLNNRKKILKVVEDIEKLGRDNLDNIVYEQSKTAATQFRQQGR